MPGMMHSAKTSFSGLVGSMAKLGPVGGILGLVFVSIFLAALRAALTGGGDGTLDSHIDADTMGAQHSSESQSKKSKN